MDKKYGAGFVFATLCSQNWNYIHGNGISSAELVFAVE